MSRVSCFLLLLGMKNKVRWWNLAVRSSLPRNRTPHIVLPLNDYTISCNFIRDFRIEDSLWIPYPFTPRNQTLNSFRGQIFGSELKKRERKRVIEQIFCVGNFLWAQEQIKIYVLDTFKADEGLSFGVGFTSLPQYLDYGLHSSFRSLVKVVHLHSYHPSRCPWKGNTFLSLAFSRVQTLCV